MSRIFFRDSYIAVVPSFDRTDLHKHPPLHLFFSERECRITVGEGEFRGNVILLDSNIKHIAKNGNGCDFFLLIDPTSTAAGQLKEKYLRDCPCVGLSDIPVNMSELSEDETVCAAEKLLSALGAKFDIQSTADERVAQVTKKLISGEWLSYSVSEIAHAVFLSESRLTHLFKEQVGVSLKGYILTRRLESAYKYVNSGGSITQAAQESGFSSSAHLAYTCKTLTGISITDVLRARNNTADF